MHADSLAALWRDKGYADIDHLAEAADISVVADLLDRLYKAAHTLASDQLNTAGGAAIATAASVEVLRTVDLDPVLASTSVYRAARELAGELLGCRAELYFDHAIRKPAGFGSGTAWHQDTAYDPYEPGRERVHFWIPMASVGLDGGCMEFVPASHLAGSVEHRFADDDPRRRTKVAVAVDDSLARPVPVEVGGATIHHRLTLHRTGPNRAAVERTAWILQFARPRTRREQTAEGLRRARRLASRQLMGQLRRRATS